MTAPIGASQSLPCGQTPSMGLIGIRRTEILIFEALIGDKEIGAPRRVIKELKTNYLLSKKQQPIRAAASGSTMS